MAAIPSHRDRRRPIPFLLSTLLACSVATPSNAANKVWEGDSNSKYTNNANWTGGQPSNDTTTDTAVFSGPLTTYLPVLDKNRSVWRLDFQSGGWNFGGSNKTLTLGSGGVLVATGAVELGMKISLNVTQAWNVSSGATLTASQSINGQSNRNLEKTGTGTLVLSGANTFSGSTSVLAGTLRVENSAALGSTAGGTTVASGATLHLDGGVTVGLEALTLSGNGVAGAGALQSSGDDNQWSGDILLAADATIHSATAGKVLTLGSNSFSETIALGTNTLTFDGPGDSYLNAEITGTGSVIKNGGGTLTYFADRNSYTGPTFVNDGLLVLDTLTGENASILGDLTVGDGIGTSGSARVRFGTATNPIADDQIAASSTVKVLADGYLDLNDQSDTFENLEIAGGTVDTGSGTLVITGEIKSTGSSGTSKILGNVALAGTDHVFDVEDGSQAVDLEFSATISDGAVRKLGGGVLRLNGSNTYTGTTTVEAGTLDLGTAAQSGNISGSAVTVLAQGTLSGNGSAGAVTVRSGGTVSPGNSPGILTTGDFSLESGATLKIELAGTLPGSEYDRLNVNGTVSLAGDLDVSLLGAFVPAHGDLFFFLVNDGSDPVSGFFNGLSDGALLSLGLSDVRIYYSGDSATNSLTGGNDVVLAAVPEHNTVAMTVLGSLYLIARRRRRASLWPTEVRR